MTQEVDLGADEGFVKFKVAGVEASLDLYETNDRIAEYHQQAKSKPPLEYNQGLTKLVESLGFSGMSQQMAVRFVQEVGRLVEAAKKKHSRGAESPASTGSTPAPSPARSKEPGRPT